jgi:shikimate kinase
MSNIIFIGMPASGKSTIGVVVAKKLGYDFIDADLLIQKQEGCLLKDIIAEKGIEGFLEVEDRVNAGIEADRAVISPGGSVVYCENAMKHFKEIGMIVYLQTSYGTIKKRIGDPVKRGVVLKEGQTLKALYEERKVLFEKYADIIICTDGLTLDQTIGKVVKSLSEN